MIADNQYITTHYEGTDGRFKVIDLDPDISDDGINYIPDLSQFAWYTLPSFYRMYKNSGDMAEREILYFYIVAICRVLQNNNTNWNSNRKAFQQRQNWNSQTLKFTQILRDVFENGNIYIEDVFSEIRQRYLFNQNEAIPVDEEVYLYNIGETTAGLDQTYLYNNVEINNVDLIIKVDISLISDSKLIEEFCKIYILDTVAFRIEWI